MSLDALLSSPALELLGRVLLHSLWEGTAIALLAALVLALLERRGAAARHAVLVLALALLALAPLATGFLLSGGSAARVPAAAGGAWLTGGGALGRALPFFGLAWVVGALACETRLLARWISAERLRRRAGRPLPPAVQRLVEDLRRRLAVRRAVRALESDAVCVPSVVGWWRPVLLLPAYALTHLSPSDLAAVLAHELAHVRRHDALAQLLQSLVEGLFFFHPAARWLSARLRLERECCCDELAAAARGDRLAYARALERLESLRVRRSPSGPAPHSSRVPLLESHGGSLMLRIQRLFRLEPRTARAPRVLLASFAGILAAGLLASAAQHEAPRPRGPRAPWAPPVARPAPAPPRGGDAAPEDLGARVERLQREVEDLGRRLERLRAERVRRGAPAAEPLPTSRLFGGTATAPFTGGQDRLPPAPSFFGAPGWMPPAGPFLRAAPPAPPAGPAPAWPTPLPGGLGSITPVPGFGPPAARPSVLSPFGPPAAVPGMLLTPLAPRAPLGFAPPAAPASPAPLGLGGTLGSPVPAAPSGPCCRPGAARRPALRGTPAPPAPATPRAPSALRAPPAPPAPPAARSDGAF